jgi:hypothetical protein
MSDEKKVRIVPPEQVVPDYFQPYSQVEHGYRNPNGGEIWGPAYVGNTVVSLADAAGRGRFLDHRRREVERLGVLWDAKKMAPVFIQRTRTVTFDEPTEVEE